MEQENKTEVIVVGAGPAGIACAITIARSGKEVVLIERGKFSGSKNVFGGAIYAQPMREIFPEFEKPIGILTKTLPCDSGYHKSLSVYNPDLALIPPFQCV